MRLTRYQWLLWSLVSVLVLGVAFILFFPGKLIHVLTALILRPIEQEFVDIVRLNEGGSTTNLKLADADIWVSVNSTQHRVIQGAPRSLEIGLANYHFLSPETRLILIQTLFLAGNPKQLERLLGFHLQDPLLREDCLQVLLLLRILKARGIAVDLRWIDMFVSSQWQEMDCLPLVSEVGRLVDYSPLQAGYGDVQECGRKWREFCGWWSANRARFIAPPGELIRTRE